MRDLLKLTATLRVRLAAVGVAMLVWVAPALAHDPREITADVHFVENRLEVMITQTHLTAFAACSMDTKSRRNFATGQFEPVRAALEKCARSAIEVKSDERRLEPTSVAATMNKDGEIEFRLAYPRPAPGSTVSLDAVMLRALLEADYVVEATILVDGKFSGQHALQVKDSQIEITLPSSAPAKEP